MGVTIPPAYDVTMRIPQDYRITADAGLDDIRIRIADLPRIFIDANANLNTDSTIRIKELPAINAQVPINLSLAIKILGLKVIEFSLGGDLGLTTT